MTKNEINEVANEIENAKRAGHNVHVEATSRGLTVRVNGDIRGRRLTVEDAIKWLRLIQTW